MTQKQAVKNIIDSISESAFKKLFLFEWLQDINWHTETQMILDSMNAEEKRIVEKYENMDESEKLTSPFIQKYRHEYHLATTIYQGLNYIFGWGIENDGWKSKGIGKEFVAELLELTSNA